MQSQENRKKGTLKVSPFHHAARLHQHLGGGGRSVLSNFGLFASFVSFSSFFFFFLDSTAQRKLEPCAPQAPGDIGGSGWKRYADPEERAFKLNAERNNGRAAMLGVTGCLIHELLGVDALYPTGGMGGAAPPTIF